MSVTDPWQVAVDDLDPPPLTGWRALDHQTPPPGEWWLWLLLGGRGTGKTDGAADYVDRWMRSHAGHRLAVIAPTLGDAVESCVRGPSGLQAHNPTVRLVTSAGGTYVRWPNSSEGRLFGAYTPDDVERLRAGGNRHLVWAEELAAWRHLDECWEHMEFGLRLGERPHVVASTTPKNRKLVRRLVAESVDDGSIELTHGTTDDNPHLDASTRARLYARYEGTRLGRQELAGELLTDTPGALWARESIDGAKVDRDALPRLVRVVVAIDPAVTVTEDSDETGIIVAGLGDDGHGYVLADESTKASPEGWARLAVQALRRHQGDRVIAEVNNGGDMVESVLRTVDDSVPYRSVRASRGKQVRAEPVAALYEQARVHHLGSFPDLEDQMCSWTPTDRESPDRMDALVWAFTELMVDTEDQPGVVTYDERVAISPF